MALALLVLTVIGSQVSPSVAGAGIGNGTPATLDDYWNGDADWVYLRKDTRASTGIDGYYNGSRVIAVADGTWYLINRQYVSTPGCAIGSLGTHIRRSTDQGATWSEPVAIVSPAAGTPWSCIATDGDLWYDVATNRWHYLFQCLAGDITWRGCLLSRDGADPMGAFTGQPAGGNPVVTPGEIWSQICDAPTDDCSAMAGGPGNVFDEGTFDIFDHDGTHYWVSFHGYDNVRGYRGIAKTGDFQTWIAGDPAQGVPVDATHDRDDSQVWRENWVGGQSIGVGHGSMLKEGGHYYDLVEAADINLVCSQNQNWDVGLFRSTSLASTEWNQLPRGNPMIYSSRDPNGTAGLCTVQYAGLFRDPTDGFIYLTYGRRSPDGNYDGLYWYRLERTDNLLANADLWRADTHGWNRLGTGTNFVAYRLPNNSPDGTPYLAANCGGTCGVNTHSIYQDVPVLAGTSGAVHFGGSFLSEGPGGNLNLVVHQLDQDRRVLATSELPVSTGWSWAPAGSSTPLLAATRTLRYEFYLNTSQLTYRADNLYLAIR